MALKVGVVGAGIVGLSAAINVQKLIKNVDVTIIGDSFGEDTTNSTSPGVFLPIPSKIHGVDYPTICEWFTDSWQHHSEMASSPEGQESGQTFMPGHVLWSDSPEGPNYLHPIFLKNCHFMTEKEKKEQHFYHRYACLVDTVVVDQPKYLRWLMKEFRRRGGKVSCNTVYALQELYGKYDIVVNCTGRRGRETVQDPYLEWDKTYGIKMKHEWHKVFLITEDNISVIPYADKAEVDVGFLIEEDEYNSVMDVERVELLLHKAKAMAPNLVGAEIIEKYVERRPHRTPPLIEIDMMGCGGPILPVVHNIGLGHNTVTLAWGTGVKTAELVQDVQRLITPFSRICRPFNTLA